MTQNSQLGSKWYETSEGSQTGGSGILSCPTSRSLWYSDVHWEPTGKGQGIKQFPLLSDQERVCVCPHMGCVYVLHVYHCVHMCFAVYTGVCAVCVFLYMCICVHGVCACLYGCVCVMSVHVLWHLRKRVMLTYTLGNAGPGRSSPELHGGRGHFPSPALLLSFCFCLFCFSVSGLTLFLQPWQLPTPHSWQRLGMRTSLFLSHLFPNAFSWALDKSCRTGIGKVRKATQARQELRERQKFPRKFDK